MLPAFLLTVPCILAFHLLSTQSGLDALPEILIVKMLDSAKFQFCLPQFLDRFLNAILCLSMIVLK